MIKRLQYIICLLCLCCATIHAQRSGETLSASATFPAVLTAKEQNWLAKSLQSEAHIKSEQHITLPSTVAGWKTYRDTLREKIRAATGMRIQHELPLQYKEHTTRKTAQYVLKNISFQTRPNVFAIASLFVPNGKGPFPAVIIMCGHSPNGRFCDKYEAVAKALAANGYVALLMDAWGAGERSTTYGKFDYHGGNLGASLMNIGETLMGMQLTDNMRGIDLLSSLPFVDRAHIGATGASGGGNQTMWLAAMDPRLKAAVPVVSVGTFESYILRSNCVCELLPDGLSFTEEAGILGLIAPRALKICNASQDINPAFNPDAMLRSYKVAQPVYNMLDAADKISYQIFDLPHGYFPEEIKSMLQWMNHYLKGENNTAVIQPVEQDSDKTPLWSFEKQQRPEGITTTATFCTAWGNVYRKKIETGSSIDTAKKRKELQQLLHIQQWASLNNKQQLTDAQGWSRYILHTTDQHSIPVLQKAPADAAKGYVILLDPMGKQYVSNAILNGYLKQGYGVLLPDLWGMGENALPDTSDYKIARYHTLVRTAWWLGKEMMGEWVKDLAVVRAYAKEQFNTKYIRIDAAKEAGLAALFLQAMQPGIDELILHATPVSYVFDTGKGIDFFSMAIHLPGILQWGDVSLAAALGDAAVQMVQPVTMSGKAIDPVELAIWQKEFTRLRKQAGNKETVLLRE